METVLAPVLVGIGVGIVTGALGAGGGILMVPVLVFGFAQGAHAATASSLVIVGLTALVSIVHHARSGAVAWRDGAVFGAVGILGAVVGSRLSVLMPERALLILFGTLLAAIAALMMQRALRTRREERQEATRGDLGETPDAHEDSAPQGAEAEQELAVAAVSASAEPAPPASRGWGRLLATATLTGLVTGFFGVGGGFIVLPMLVIAIGLPIRLATGTSLLVMIISTAVSLLARVGAPVEIDWSLTVLLAGGSMLGGALGGPLASRARPSTLALLFALLLSAVSIMTLGEVAFG